VGGGTTISRPFQPVVSMSGQSVMARTEAEKVKAGDTAMVAKNDFILVPQKVRSGVQLPPKFAIVYRICGTREPRKTPLKQAPGMHWNTKNA
jgi:hypothetical protein